MWEGVKMDIGTWNEIGKKAPWILVLAIVIAVFAVVTDDASASLKSNGIPTMSEWKREATREARRACIAWERHENQQLGMPLHQCINGSQRAGGCRRQLWGTTAWCEGSFTVRFHERIHQFRPVLGTVHMHVWNYRPRKPKIAVERPIHWRVFYEEWT